MMNTDRGLELTLAASVGFLDAEAIIKLTGCKRVNRQEAWLKDAEALE